MDSVFDLPERPEHDPIIDAAEKLIAAGLGLTVCHGDRATEERFKKKPVNDSWQGGITSIHVFRQQYVSGNWVGSVGGRPSGGVVCLDHDAQGVFYERWREAVKRRGAGHLLKGLYVEKTPSDGRHVAWRTSEPGPSTQLAHQKLTRQQPDSSEKSIRNGKEVVTYYIHKYGKKHECKQVADGSWVGYALTIETKAKGGQFVCAPSLGYVAIEGSLESLPIYTPEEAQILLDCAREYDEREKDNKEEEKKPQPTIEPAWTEGTTKAKTTTNRTHDDLDEIKRDMSALCAVLGVPGSGSHCCPYHDDSSPSLSVGWSGGTAVWHCFAGCGAGTIVDAVALRDKISAADAIRKLCPRGGKWTSRPTVPAEPAEPTAVERDERAIESMDRYPLQALHSTHRNMAESDAEACAVPVEMPACHGWGVMGALTARSGLECGWQQGLIETPNLYVASLADVSERKSSMARPLMKELYRIHAAEVDEWREQVAAALKKKKTDKATDEPLPPQPCYVVGDYTEEALLKKLGGVNKCVLISSTEEILRQSIIGYGQSQRSALLLCGWSGDPYQCARSGSGDVDCMRPLLGLALTCQPEAIIALAREVRGARELGLLSRVLWSWPRSLVGSRPVKTPGISQAAQEKWDELVKRLAAADGNYTLGLSPGAAGMLDSWAAAVESQMGPGGVLHSIRDWCGKAQRGQAIRLATVLHWVAHVEGGQTGAPAHEIGEETMASALALTKYHMGQAAKILGRLEDTSDQGMLSKIASFAEKRREFATYAIKHHVWAARGIKAPQLTELVETLVAIGVLGVKKNDKGATTYIFRQRYNPECDRSALARWMMQTDGRDKRDGFVMVASRNKTEHKSSVSNSVMNDHDAVRDVCDGTPPPDTDAPHRDTDTPTPSQTSRLVITHCPDSSASRDGGHHETITAPSRMTWDELGATPSDPNDTSWLSGLAPSLSPSRYLVGDDGWITVLRRRA